MRAAEPAFNVELRQDRQGQAFVVFSFPYLAEIVDAVRAIPGRRFDWEAREWWAPRADATAPFIKGVLERFPSAAHILGADALAERDEAVRAFQQPDGPQLIICATRVAAQRACEARAALTSRNGNTPHTTR